MYFNIFKKYTNILIKLKLDYSVYRFWSIKNINHPIWVNIYLWCQELCLCFMLIWNPFGVTYLLYCLVLLLTYSSQPILKQNRFMVETSLFVFVAVARVFRYLCHWLCHTDFSLLIVALFFVSLTVSYWFFIVDCCFVICVTDCVIMIFHCWLLFCCLLLK